MKTSAKLWVSTVLGSALTGAYWIGFSLIAYGLTAGDQRPGTRPNDQREIASAWLPWIAGFVLYGGLAWVWRRIDFGIASRRRR